MSARLLIAVADDETARRAAAQAREAELEVVDMVIDPDELHRALRRLDVDVVLLHDALGGTPVLDLARELSAAFPEVGLILLAAEDSPGLLRAAMQAGLRDVVALPLALESFEASVRAASQWSRTMRDRVTGEESAGGALGGQLDRRRRAPRAASGRPRSRCTSASPRPGWRPGRPVCLVDFDLQKGDFRALLDTPHRRSVVDLVVVSNEISVRHLQETLYTHKDGFRLLLAPEEGEKAEDVDSDGRPQRARGGQGAPRADRRRHRRRRHRGDRDRGRDGDPGARRDDARTCSRCAACGGCASSGSGSACARTRTSQIVLNRASRRREIQPDLARKVVGDTMAQTTIPADFNALEAAVNTGSPSRLEDNKLRGAFEALANELEIVPRADEVAPRDDEPRGLLARLGGERGQTTVEFMGMFPILLVIVPRCSGRSRSPATRTSPPATPRARAPASSRPTRPTPTTRRACPSKERAKEPYREAARKDLQQRLAQGRRDRAARRRHGLGAPAGAGADPGHQVAADDRLDRRHRARGRRPDRPPGHDAVEEQVRRGRELELMLRRLLSEERGQVATEFMGMLWLLLLCARLRLAAACSSPGRSIRPPTPRAPRAASRRADGNAEKAAHWAVSLGPARRA